MKKKSTTDQKERNQSPLEATARAEVEQFQCLRDAVSRAGQILSIWHAQES